MNKPGKDDKEIKRTEIRSLDIPWWIGGPKVIAVPSRRREEAKESS